LIECDTLAISLLKGKQARSTMAAYPEYNARVLLSTGCNAGEFVDRSGTGSPVLLGLGRV